MSLQEQMEAAVTQLEAAHEVNRAAYRKALDAQKAAGAAVRETCGKAHVSANELGAAKNALAELQRTGPEIKAVGDMKADDAGAV